MQPQRIGERTARKRKPTSTTRRFPQDASLAPSLLRHSASMMGSQSPAPSQRLPATSPVDLLGAQMAALIAGSSSRILSRPVNGLPRLAHLQMMGTLRREQHLT